MRTDRSTAVMAGILWIAATASALTGSALTAPVHKSVQSVMSPGVGDRVVVGALFTLAAGVFSALIAGVMFPLLRRWREGVAVSYVVIRTLEGVTLLLSALTALLLVTVGRQGLGADLGALLEGAHGWLFPMNPIVFGPGAALVYYAILRTRMFPAWLSVWGLIGAACVVVFAVTAMFGLFPVWLALPIGLQEMVLAVWLIVKGFGVPEQAVGKTTVGRSLAFGAD